MNNAIKISKGQQLLNIEYTARYIHKNTGEDTSYQQGKLAQYELEARSSGISVSEVSEAITKGRQS